MSKFQQWIFKRAIKVVINELEKDKDYYYGWQANIAMAFVDEVSREKDKKTRLTSKNIHKIANQSAKNFLNLLIFTK